MPVARGLARKQATTIARIGVDEKAFRKGHRYLTIVNDVDGGTVEFVADGREQASVAAFYESRTPEQLAGIEAVAMDMWEPSIQSTPEAVPLATSKIFFDRFHVMQHMTEAVDVVRRRENRLLTAEDDRLKGTKYLWISSTENVHPKRRAEFRFLRGSDLKTARAWAIEENRRHLWSFRVEGRVLPQRLKLQDRDLLLLRRGTALPMKIPDGPQKVVGHRAYSRMSHAPRTSLTGVAAHRTAATLFS